MKTSRHPNATEPLSRVKLVQDFSTPGARPSSSMRFVARALSAAESREIDTSLAR